ncbi:MAG: hypothetical protein QXO15_12590, partial [Nitrososphaerota archaeon]
SLILSSVFLFPLTFSSMALSRSISMFHTSIISEGLIKKLEEISMNVPVVITGQPIFGGVNLRVYEGSWTEINRYKRHTSARHEQRVATVKLM